MGERSVLGRSIVGCMTIAAMFLPAGRATAASVPGVAAGVIVYSVHYTPALDESPATTTRYIEPAAIVFAEEVYGGQMFAAPFTDTVTASLAGDFGAQDYLAPYVFLNSVTGEREVGICYLRFERTALEGSGVIYCFSNPPSTRGHYLRFVSVLGPGVAQPQQQTALVGAGPIYTSPI
jgi:hypothetical protein